MKRRINWALGDSSPISGQLVAAVSGSGTMKITTGWPVSAAVVFFASSYQDQGPSYSYIGSGSDPEVFVSSKDSDGFTITYRNIIDELNVGYFAM